MPRFTHERLDVYHTAIEFVKLSTHVTSELPRGHGHIASQLRRAAISIPLNIAEGAGEFSGPGKARSYRIARRSALECVAIFEVVRALECAGTTRIHSGRELLDGIVAMLTRLILAWEDRGAGNPERTDGDADEDVETA